MEIKIKASATHITYCSSYSWTYLGSHYKIVKTLFISTKPNVNDFFSLCTEAICHVKLNFLAFQSFYTYVHTLVCASMYLFASILFNWSVQKVPMLITCNNWRKKMKVKQKCCKVEEMLCMLCSIVSMQKGSRRI